MDATSEEYFASVVESIAVYQRTPAWVVPRTDHPVKPMMRRLYRFVPGLQKGVRSALYLFREFLVIGMAKRRRFLAPVGRLAVAGRQRILNRGGNVSNQVIWFTDTTPGVPKAR